MQGALIEPLGVGFHAANQGGAHIGQTAVVTGAGCIGLMSSLALKAMGYGIFMLWTTWRSGLRRHWRLGQKGVVNGRRKTR